MTIVLIIIVALTAPATITLWGETVRRPARPSENFVHALLRSDPIEPKHGKPTKWAYEDDAPLALWEGTPVGTMFDERRSYFFDFVAFAEVVNSWFEWMEDRWRLQELSDNELQFFSQDFPSEFGRRYSIFYNHADLGVLEMKSAHG